MFDINCLVSLKRCDSSDARFRPLQLLISFKRGTGGMSSELAQVTDKAALDLKRRIIIFLSQKGVSSVRLLDIDVANGTVTFRGTVASFYERQLCLSCDHVPGVRKVVDDLKVEIPSPHPPR